MLGNHGLCGLPEEDAHRKSPKCLDGNLGDFGEFCKGLQSLRTRRRSASQATVDVAVEEGCPPIHFGSGRTFGRQQAVGGAVRFRCETGAAA